VKKDGSTAGEVLAFGPQQSVDQSSKEAPDRFRNPLQSRIVGKRLLPHEPVKFGNATVYGRASRIPRSRASGDKSELSGADVPSCPYLRERMFSRRTPENVLASVVVCDERCCRQAICNRANARSFESPFGELRNGSVQDRASRLKRALLFGSLARTPRRSTVDFSFALFSC